MVDFPVLSSISSAEIPEDLKKSAKASVSRKVNRLLERALYPPVIAAVELRRRAGESVDDDRFAAFTVSNWDPAIPIPDYAHSDDPGLIERLSHFYMHPADPLDWLRRFCNNPVCNIGITTGTRGPAMHYVGGADSLAMLTTVAISALANDSASMAVITAFDLPAGAESMLASQSDSRAAAVLVGPGTGDAPSAYELVGFAEAAAPGTTAVEALDGFIARTRPGAGLLAGERS